MSRVYQKPPAPTARQPPASTVRQPPASTARQPPTATVRQPLATRTPLRPNPPPPTSTTRGVRAPIRGRTTHTQPPRQERNDNEDGRTDRQERTVHVGDGYHMFTPSTTKREQMRRQAENEQRQYEEHTERTRLRNLHEVHRLGGDALSEEEVRRRQAEKYRREKFTRLEKTHQDEIQKKQDEERDLEAKKQAARQQSMENEKRDRNGQLRSMRSTVNQSDQGATGWTNDAREEDRRKTMDRFLNRLTNQYDDMNISEKKNQNNLSKSEKLAILHDTLPDIDDSTLEYYLETYNGDIDTIVHELLN